MKFRVRWSFPLKAVAAFVGAWFLSQPFGNFPLNDDWQYAAVTKRLYETGRIWIDTPIAPSLVGQVLMVQPVLWVTGWSHVTLRIVTLILSLGILFFIRSLWRNIKLSATQITFLLLLLIFNPLFFYSSQTFMTEIYAYFVAFFGVFLWYILRVFLGRFNSVPWPVWILCSLLFVVSFWIRQFAVVLFPALVGAWFFREWFSSPEGSLKLAKQYLPRVLVSVAILVVGIIGYFTWAKVTGNSKPAFMGPLSNIAGFSLKGWVAGPVTGLLYLSFLFWPAGIFFAMKWAFSRDGSPVLRRWIYAAFAVGIVIAIYGALRTEGLIWTRWMKPRFPFLGNLIYDTGLGPITMTDTFHYSMQDRPKWPSWIWATVGAFSTALVPVWISFFRRAPALYRKLPSRFEKELFLFGLLVFFGTEFAVIQSYRHEIFDRYHLLPLMGLLFPLASFLKDESFGETPWRASRLALIPLLMMAIYSTLGMHDYHAWNRVRWKFVEELKAQGISPFSIEGGFEVDGWHLHDDSYQPKTPNAESCIGPCATDGVWHAPDTSYRVTFNILPGYEVMKEEAPGFWLAPGPTIKLLRRISK
jgi:hypothetical protein